MIELSSVTKRFKELAAVDRLSLTIKKGTLFGFLGPNGAGKTTTIKMLVGVMRPTEGKILIDGIDIQEDDIGAKRLIGYIPDRPYLYEKLSADEFIRFTTSLFGIYQDEKFKARYEELLELFSLVEWRNELIENFSHGMKQRLILISVLVRDPEIIIVDEPMVGLDPIAAKIVKELLIRTTQDGKTVFMSTHSLWLAQEICSDIGVINKGRLILNGKRDEIMKQFEESPSLEDIFLKVTTEGKDLIGKIS